MIGDKLKKARSQCHYTQAQVAHKLNVSPKTISSWENNHSYPDVTVVVQLSDLYAVPLDLLLRKDKVLSIPLDKSIKENPLHKSPLPWSSYLVVILTLFKLFYIISRLFGLSLSASQNGLCNVLLTITILTCAKSTPNFLNKVGDYSLPIVTSCTCLIGFISNTIQLSHLPFTFLLTNTDNTSYMAGALLSALVFDAGLFCSSCALVHLYHRIQKDSYVLT